MLQHKVHDWRAVRQTVRAMPGVGFLDDRNDPAALSPNLLSACADVLLLHKDALAAGTLHLLARHRLLSDTQRAKDAKKLKP